MKQTQLIDLIIAELRERFADALLDETYAFEQRSLLIAPAAVKSVMEFLRFNPHGPFDTLIDLTALDLSPAQPHFQVVYLLHSFSTRARIRIKVPIDRQAPQLPSVVDLWPGANWCEREVFDLFGIQFSGHPDLRRLLMPEDWQGHPLRKDYALTEELVEFKGHVPTQTPSQLIPKKYANPQP